MDARKNTPTQQPKRVNRQVSQRGMLSIVMLMVSLVALAYSLVGGIKVVHDVLDAKIGTGTHMLVPVIVIGVAYGVGWITAMVAIRVYGNLILPMLINVFIWICLAGVCYLYIAILTRLYDQEYELMNYVKYVFVMLTWLTAMVGLHLIVEDHNLRPFAIPLLIISMFHLGLIVFRYVFDNGNAYYLPGDLLFLFGMSAFSIFMLAHVGLLNPLRKRFTSYFDMNSVAIRSHD